MLRQVFICFAFVALVALLTAIKLALPLIGGKLPFILYFGIIMLASWYGGLVPAAITAGLSAFAANYFFLPPRYAFSLDPTTLFQTGVFVAESLLIIALTKTMRSARLQVESDAARLARLYRLTGGLSAALTPEEVADVVVKQGADALGAVTGTMVQPRYDGQLELVGEMSLSSDRKASSRIFPHDAPYLLADVFRTGRVELITSSEEYAKRYSSLGSQSDTPGAAAAVPLRIEQRTIGAVAFDFAESRSFDRAARSLLNSFAAQAAQALDRAHTLVSEVALRRKLEVLSQTAEALSTALTRADVARIVVDSGTLAMAADTCTLYVVNSHSGSLDLIADRGVAPGIIEHIRNVWAGSENPIWKTLTSGEPMWVESDDEYAERIPAIANLKVEGPRIKAFWSVPLVVEGQSIGLLGMGFHKAHTFSPEERAFVETFARQCAQALLRSLRLESETAARRAAESAQSSLATTLRSIGDAVISTDASGAVTLLNPVAAELTGWTEAEAQGRSLDEVFRIVNEHTRQPVESPVTKVLREGMIVGLANHTILLGRRAGHETPIDDSGAPVRDDSGAIRGVVLVFRSAREQKNRELRRALLTEAASTIATSLDYRATLARLAELLVPRLSDWCSIDMLEEGASRSEQLAVAHVDPAKVEQARELRRRYLADPSAPRGVPNVLRTGRSEIYADVTDEMLVQGAIDDQHLQILRELRLRSAILVPLISRGAVLGVITMVYAESGRHYTEEDLAFIEEIAGRAAIAVENARLYGAEQRARSSADAANRLKDEFLATLSHELRTPLNAILGWSRMLTAGVVDDAKRGRALETIDRNAVSMTRLIEDILDVSRIISGKMRIEVEPLDLTRIVDTVIMSIKPAADAKQITLHSLFESTPEPFLGDPNRLQQVVWNLLSNAVKFTPKDGRVNIVVRRSDSCIELSVSDTGVGIALEFVPYVFDRFRQADGRVTRSHGGLGLGLAITRHLVELHGGHIEAYSEGAGRGATFTVKLPAAANGKIEPSHT